eukprot:767867-Hanusia_phi.AAC.6
MTQLDSCPPCLPLRVNGSGRGGEGGREEGREGRRVDHEELRWSVRSRETDELRRTQQGMWSGKELEDYRYEAH